MAIAASSRLMVSTVRVSNFRALRNIELKLNELTILVGANNVGKTTFLDALHAAIGAVRRPLGKEDIYIAAEETDVPKDRKAVIDVLIRPFMEDGTPAESFPAASFWTNLWGDGISQDEDTGYSDFVGIRTTIAWSAIHGEHRTERCFLKEWRPFDSWLEAEEKGKVSAVQVEPIALHYIDAQRDLEEDLKARSSFWRRLTDELGLADEDIAAFESVLTDLNRRIVDGSEVLKHIRNNLGGLGKVVADKHAAVDISPVARRLRDLSKGVDVAFSTGQCQSFPLTRHGMGTRSLASLMVFRAFASWRQELASRSGDSIHTILALEEPEAHLHPQAQRSLFGQIRCIPGQRIVSTHSPYFAGQARLEDLRLFRKDGDETRVSNLETTDLEPDDRRKLEFKIIASRGDLLFSRALVLFEGETEELALPVLAEAYWGASVHELGFCFVGVGGSDYFPFIWLARKFEIPWFIFSDGEKEPLKKLMSNLKRAGLAEPFANVLVLPNGNDFEKQLVDEGFLTEVEEGLDQAFGEPSKLDRWMAEMHGTLAKKGVIRDYSVPRGREIAAVDHMRHDKTRVALPIAQHIAATGRLPTKVRELFVVISEAFGLQAAESSPSEGRASGVEGEAA